MHPTKNGDLNQAMSHTVLSKRLGGYVPKDMNGNRVCEETLVPDVHSALNQRKLHSQNNYYIFTQQTFCKGRKQIRTRYWRKKR
jgi:hypothetical protein